MPNSTDSLSKNAQVVQTVLSKKGLPFKVIEISASTHTAKDAAATIGCNVAQIIKSLIFTIKENNKPVLILASGVNRVNEKALETQLGMKIEKANANFTKEVTGFVIGGVPPVGHKQVIETFIDEDLLQYSELWAAAGTPNAVFMLYPADLIQLTDGKVISIK